MYISLADQYILTKLTILKNEVTFKVANVAKSIKYLASKISPAIEVEKLLVVWINEEQLANEFEVIICEKAVQYITEDTPGAKEFKASKGWFDNFTNIIGIHSMVGIGRLALQTMMLPKTL